MTKRIVVLKGAKTYYHGDKRYRQGVKLTIDEDSPEFALFRRRPDLFVIDPEPPKAPVVVPKNRKRRPTPEEKMARPKPIEEEKVDAVVVVEEEPVEESEPTYTSGVTSYTESQLRGFSKKDLVLVVEEFGLEPIKRETKKSMLQRIFELEV